MSFLDQAKQALTRKVGVGKYKVPIWTVFAAAAVGLWFWRKKHAPKTAQGVADTGVTSDQGSGSLGDYAGGAGGGATGGDPPPLPDDVPASWDPGTADGGAGSNYDTNNGGGGGYTVTVDTPVSRPPVLVQLPGGGYMLPGPAQNQSVIGPDDEPQQPHYFPPSSSAADRPGVTPPAKQQTPSGVSPVRTIGPSAPVRVQNPSPVLTSHEAIQRGGENVSVPVTTASPQVRVGSGRAID